MRQPLIQGRRLVNKLKNNIIDMRLDDRNSIASDVTAIEKELPFLLLAIIKNIITLIVTEERI